MAGSSERGQSGRMMISYELHIYIDYSREAGRKKKEVSGMYTLMWYIKEYVYSHSEEYQQWMKEKGGEGNE